MESQMVSQRKGCVRERVDILKSRDLHLMSNTSRPSYGGRAKFLTSWSVSFLACKIRTIIRPTIECFKD